MRSSGKDTTQYLFNVSLTYLLTYTIQCIVIAQTDLVDFKEAKVDLCSTQLFVILRVPAEMNRQV